MSFTSGKLLKVGNYTIPLAVMNVDSYECTPNQRQDIDSYRDLNQDLHRNVAENYKTVVKFTTRPRLEETVLRAVVSNIKNNYSVAKERKVHLEYFNTDTGNYSTGDFYLVQPQYKIMQIQGSKIFYNSMDFEFIEY